MNKDAMDKVLDDFAEAGKVWDGVNPRTLRGAPDDDWARFIAPENPIKEATVCGENVSFEAYSAQPPGVKRGHPDYILSRSDLSEIASCPHRWVSGYRDDESTTSTEWGALLDCLLMDPDSLEQRFAIVPETYRNEKGEDKPWNFNANVCKEWREQQGGKEEVKPGVLKAAREAAQLLLDDPVVAELFRSSRKQVMVVGYYADAATGVRVPLRGLIDLVPPKYFLADLKTCTCAHPRAWVKHVHQFGYHIQAASYLDLWNAATGEDRREFRHIIQESYPPFEPAKRLLSSEFIAIGRDRYLAALQRYAKCIKTGDWPGYDDTNHPADLVIDGHLVVQPEAWMAA